MKFAILGPLINIKIQVEVFWVVTPCSVVVGYQRHIPEDLDLNLHRRESIKTANTKTGHFIYINIR
jgi:hypothetical protein